MKKLLAILLGGAMFASALAGLVGCKDDHEHVDVDPKDGKCDVCGEDMSGPGGPGIEKPTIVRRTDPRAADAYEAYDYAGNKIGSYKTIADAINATIEGDLDYFEDEAVANASLGGYVLKKGGTRKLFQNKKGLTDSYGDQFWLYPNGNTLGGYGSWDEAHMTNYLRNQKNTIHAVASFGQVSMQFYNGFGLLDEHGKEDTTSNTPMSWALGTAIDAGIMVFPSSAGGQSTGFSKATYKLDLSEVKITPAYEGVETPVYAYFGYYIWNPQYVLAIGLGCDTTTGQWYQFSGTSRDDSFSNVEYDMGECIMESTWNEDGYFVPNGKEVDMSVQTVKMHDDELDEDYFICELNFAVAGGKTLKVTVDDAFMATYFAEPINVANDYLFIAGLDVKNDIGSGVKVKNVDYFNGAKFEGLRVTDAHVYFPTEDEISDVDYGSIVVPEEVRGNEYDFLLANEEEAVEDVEDGKKFSAYGYTILSNYMCTTYTAEDGMDRYDFKFDGSPVADDELGGKLKEYQDQIDSLSGMTAENISQYMEKYDEVGKWYGQDEGHTGSTLAEFYYTVLDFAPYKAAESVYLESMNISDAGKAVLAKLNGLNLCTATSYPYQGWEAPEGTPIAGYIWSEAQEFAKIRTELKTLPEDEQVKIIRLSSGGQDGYDDWEELYDSVSAYLANETYTSKTYHVGTMTLDGKFEDYDGTAALTKLIAILYRDRTNWFKKDGASEDYVMNSDSQLCVQYNFHALFMIEKMKEGGVEVPSFVETMVDLVTNTPNSAAFLSDYRDYLYPVLTKIGEIYARQQKGEFVWLDQDLADFVNEYMVGIEGWQEAGFKWNWANGTKRGIRDRVTNYEYYFGLPNGETAGEDDLEPTLKILFDIVTMCDPNAKVLENGLGFEAEVTPMAEDPSAHGSDTAVALLNKIKALTVLETYEYKGWTTDQTTKTGYLFDELTAFRALVAEREELGAIDKAYVIAQLGKEDNAAYKANYEAWEKLSAEIKALEETADTFWTKEFKTVEPGYNKTTVLTKTGEQVLAETYRVVALVKSGKVIENTGYYGETDGKTSFIGEGAPDATFYTAMWTARMVRFALDSGVTLPAGLTAGLTEIGYFTFYTQTYYPIMGTLRIAERIGKNEIKKMEDFTEDELAFLNEVWTAGYEQQGSLKTHWGAGKFETWWGDRAARFVQDVGGTLTANGASLKLYEYVNVLSTFLANNHYVVKENGWGTTAKEILNVTLTENALALVTEFEKIGNLDTYTAKGWKAPEGSADIKGYLYSEAEYYTNTIKAKLSGLTEEDVEKISILVGVSNYEDWAVLAEEILALDAEKVALEIEAADGDGQDAKAKTYTVGEALGELLAALARADAAGEKLGFDNGIDKGVSFRPYFFYFALEDLDVEIPSVIVDRMDALKMDETAAGKFEEDLHYIITVLKIAKAITADPNHKLTAAEIEMINATMVGKAKFVDGGFSYAFITDTSFGDPVSWHAKSKGYRAYFGLDVAKNFSVYQTQVINYLVEKYHATALKYDHASATEDNVMGIVEAIKAE